MEVLIVRDVVGEAAQLFADRIRDGVGGGRRFSMALSGGRTPRSVFERLASAADVAWEQVDVFQVDERVSPAGDPDRNLTHLDATLLDRVPAVVHPLPVDADDLTDAATGYAARLPPVLDLVHLGLGADGHTASLVPGDPVLDVTNVDVALTGTYAGRRRMTLTFPAIDRAASIVWIVSGEDKRDALAELLAGDPGIPAGRVARDRALVVTDLA